MGFPRQTSAARRLLLGGVIFVVLASVAYGQGVFDSCKRSDGGTKLPACTKKDFKSSKKGKTGKRFCCEMIQPKNGPEDEKFTYQIIMPRFAEGKGGFVFHARLTKAPPHYKDDIARHLALKVTRPHALKGKVRAEGLQEARVSLKLNVPFGDPHFPVIAMLPGFERKGMVMLPLEYVGPDLVGFMSYFHQRVPGYRENGKCMICQLSKGMAYYTAHRTFLRDIKPDNIILLTADQHNMDPANGRLLEESDLARRNDNKLRVPDPMSVKWTDFGKAINVDRIRGGLTWGRFVDQVWAAPNRANPHMNVPRSKYSTNPLDAPLWSYDTWGFALVIASIATGEDVPHMKNYNPLEDLLEDSEESMALIRDLKWNKDGRSWSVSSTRQKELPERDRVLFRIIEFGAERGMYLLHLVRRMLVKDSNNKLYRASPIETVFHPYFLEVEKLGIMDPTQYAEVLAAFAEKVRQIYAEASDDVLPDGRQIFLATYCTKEWNWEDDRDRKRLADIVNECFPGEVPVSIHRLLMHYLVMFHKYQCNTIVPSADKKKQIPLLRTPVIRMLRREDAIGESTKLLCWSTCAYYIIPEMGDEECEVLDVTDLKEKPTPYKYIGGVKLKGQSEVVTEEELSSSSQLSDKSGLASGGSKHHHQEGTFDVSQSLSFADSDDSRSSSLADSSSPPLSYDLESSPPASLESLPASLESLSAHD